MSTVKLVDEHTDHPKVRAVFEDIKATKKIDRVPNIWRALATQPEHLELCWTRLKAIMQPGKLDLLTKEIIALAVSVTNSCHYGIKCHNRSPERSPAGYFPLLSIAASRFAPSAFSGHLGASRS